MTTRKNAIYTLIYSCAPRQRAAGVAPGERHAQDPGARASEPAARCLRSGVACSRMSSSNLFVVRAVSNPAF